MTSALMGSNAGGLYIHIPFCRKKCLYCDFFSGGVRIADWHALSRAILAELDSRFSELPSVVSSIYFGGGTPSVMPAEEMRLLFSEVKRRIGERIAENAEITIEINPEDVSLESVKKWKETGFNRVSLGIESFDDSLLSSMGRHHTGSDAIGAIKLLKERFSNVSADLIFGLPGQTPDMLESDLRIMINQKPDHISLYCLMFEPGTALTQLRNSGRIVPVDDETQVLMSDTINKYLSKAGYVRYEISNWALPGKHSRHNTLYWTGAPYLGLGPSAHSYDGKNVRRFNPADLKGYLSNFTGSVVKDFFDQETLNIEELREEFIMTRLRLKDGFETDDFKRRFGESLNKRLTQAVKTQAENGFLEAGDGRVSLSEKGIMVSDRVILSLSE